MAKKEISPVVVEEVEIPPVVVEEVEIPASLELCNLVAQGMSVSEAKAVLSR
jgi:hypothetical protein